MSSFVPATKPAVPAHIAIAGPGGSGKTYTALAIATAFGGPIGLIDTNRRSSLLYAGLNKWEFDVVHPQTFSPESFVDLVLEAGDAGYKNLIVDTWAHYWNGPDGMLEQVDARSKGNVHQGWKEMRPAERAMMDTLLNFPGNVIVTLRVKTEVVVEPIGDNERAVPRRVGLKPEQREGLEYEFDLYGDMDPEHGMIVTKSRIPDLANTYHAKPGKVLATKITKFLSAGETIPSATELRDGAFAATTKDEVNLLGRQAVQHGLLQALVRGADDAVNTLENVLMGRRQSLPTADELAAQRGDEDAETRAAATEPIGDNERAVPREAARQVGEQRRAQEHPDTSEEWQQPDAATPDYITGKPEEAPNA